MIPNVAKNKSFSQRQIWVYILGFVFVGLLATLIANASVAQSAFEAESGAMSAGAVRAALAGASGGQVVRFGAGVSPTPAPVCTVSSQLVNSCRPWLGATASYYSMAGGVWDKNIQINYFEKRLNNPQVLADVNASTVVSEQLDMVHVYMGQGDTLSGASLSFASRANTYLQLNWKPTAGTWDTAAGGNGTVDAGIVAMAQSIKAIAPKKVLLAIFHEPENDVTPGTAGACATAASGSKGSPASYVAMWRNVRSIFDAQGVSNVVWNMNYMGWDNYNCLVPLLWPGNNLVDWITYDPYTGGTATCEQSISAFYNFLSSSSNNDATHDYLGKTWGLGEHGYWNQNGKQGSTDALQLNYWAQVKDVVVNNRYPKLKLYSVFDASADSTLQPTTYINGPFVGLRKTVSITPYIEGQAAFNDYAKALLHLGQ